MRGLGEAFRHTLLRYSSRGVPISWLNQTSCDSQVVVCYYNELRVFIRMLVHSSFRELNVLICSQIKSELDVQMRRPKVWTPEEEASSKEASSVT